MLLEPGYKLQDRYEIKRALGGGAFGNVYLAYDHSLLTEVAIKELKLEWLSDPVVRKRFIDDARAMRRLEHPNIVTVYDLLEPDKDSVENYYIIMQYMRNGSLEGLLRRERILPIRNSVEMIIGICRALEIAHVEGIIHRDIKPDNILLGATGEVKLSDFGVAHIPESGSSSGQHGTLIWLSVEQAKGQRTVDGRSDLYSLTAVLYRMLTGRYYLDFEGCIVRARRSASHLGAEEERRCIHQEVCTLIVNTRPRRPSIHRHEIPEQLDVNILKGLAEKPEYRFQTASDMAEALAAVARSMTEDAETKDLQRAIKLLDEDRLDEATQVTEEVLRKHRDSAAGYEVMGDIYLRRGEFATAVDRWEKAVKLQPGRSSLYPKLGKLYSRLDYFDKAAQTFQKGLERIPDDPNLFYGLAVALWERGKHKAAIEALSTSCRLQPNKRKEALLARWTQQSPIEPTESVEDHTVHG